MDKAKKMRVLKSENILSNFLDIGESFYVGLLYEDFMKSPNLAKYNLPTNKISGEYIPAAKGSVTRANSNGKYVRKQPEEKVTKKVEIKYTKKDGTKVHYKRDFNVYAKELLHQYNISLKYAVNEHGQKLVISPLLKFSNDPVDNMKNTHIINIFCEICNDYEIISSTLEPAIKFNKRFDTNLLPQGKLSNPKNFSEVINVVTNSIKDQKQSKAFMERLKVIQEYDPDIRGKGPNGFYGYIVFGFSNKDIVILESMYLGHATYVFNAKDYENKVIKDKQDVINNNVAIKRFFHLDNWESNIRAYLAK